MCKHWKACLCWRDTKSPSVAIGVFALVTSLIQILVVVAVTTGNDEVPDLMNFHAVGIVIKLYVALACCDFFVIVFSIIFLIGLERTDGCHRCSVIFWLIWVFLYILYECAINICFFYLQLSSSRTEVFPNHMGYSIVPLVYWICKEFVLFTGWAFIASHLCYGDALKSSDSTLHLTDSSPNVHQYTLGATKDAVVPIYYNGGVSKVQIRDNRQLPSTYIDAYLESPRYM